MFKWSALDELKSIPIVSPVFCFTGPFLLKKDVISDAISINQTRIYAFMFFVAGVLFVLFSVGFYAHKAKVDEYRKDVNAKKIPDARLEKYLNRVTYSLFAIAAVGLALLSSAIIDMVLFVVFIAG